MLWQRLTSASKDAVIKAQEAAAGDGVKEVLPEHFLLGLLRNPDTTACRVLQRIGLSLFDLSQEVVKELRETRGTPVSLNDVTLSPRAKRCLDFAYDEARKRNDNYIGTEHQLLGILREGDGAVFRLLTSKGADLERVQSELDQYRAGETAAPAPSNPDHRARTCEEVRDQLVAYARGELDAERRTDVEEHLARCEGCSQELESARQVMAVTAMADDHSVVEATSALIQNAIGRHASDIHIETDRNGPHIRLRIDGVLRFYDLERTLTPDLHRALIARLKMMAKCAAAETGVTQDGRMSIKNSEGRTFDLRVSFLPHIHGEDAVIRILARGSVPIGLEELGVSPEVISQLMQLVTRPNGLVISTGPAGGGKLTLLYALISRICRPEIKILTIEASVEYELPGITQVHANERSGMTFAAALRAFMRQDPDVIMVGKQPDRETLEMTAEIAQTGHLVLSALDTRDAPSALTRLI